LPGVADGTRASGFVGRKESNPLPLDGLVRSLRWMPGRNTLLPFTAIITAKRDRYNESAEPTLPTLLRRTLMYVVSVTVHVKPEKLESFIQATLDNARHTRQEPGNVRFDVLQAEAEPTRFLLYEAYQTPEDFARHQQTEHYLRWRQAVADAMAEPRQGVRHNSLFFGDQTTGGTS